MMATDPAAPIPTSSAADQSVLIRGSVLRELRRQTGMRLVDLAGERRAVTRLSRLERRPAYRMTVPLLNDLLRALHLGFTFAGIDTWHAAVVGEAITRYTRGDLRGVRRALVALHLVVSPCPADMHLLAETFTARSDEPRVPDRTAETMCRLRQRAEQVSAWPAAAWAHLFESEAHEALGIYDEALDVAMSAIGIPHTTHTVLPMLCLSAAAARGFARCGRPADGLPILEKVPVGVLHPYAAAQLSRAAALLHEVAGMFSRAAICLERAAEAAMTIPNPTFCAEVREDLASLHARDGRPDIASTERLRAAALYRRAGYVEAALALMDAALQTTDVKR
jgi:hypothetical protein